ncbi:hypothetical protein GGQ84_001290 [Desulfitispora alkaliphila]|uniref:hypothetical protein n=1 Tax=Desulfitispora alkaliphila TaxID=622674 RepID=UPI003D1914B0
MDKQTGDDIRFLFKENVSDMSLGEDRKRELIMMKDRVKPMSPVEKFLEKEICIHVSSLTTAAGAMVVAVGLLFNALLLPGDVPEPKYQIIEMHNSYSYNYSQTDNGGGRP